MFARLFVALQYVVPQHLLTAMMWRIARIRHHGIKNFLITRFVTLYDVDVDEVRLSVPGDFNTFNDFFIRELSSDARAPDTGDDSIVSPVDGTVSVAGTINDGIIIQAKRIDYTLDDLLGSDLAESRAYRTGSFATIYLAPHNYHRVHSPINGELVAARYVPGDLFSVNVATVAHVNGLFRRNERLVMHFDTKRGPAAVIFVGAMMVGSISTPWSGEVRPRSRGTIDVLDISRHPTTLRKGDLLGWFNMGSTVIVLLPDGVCEWRSGLEPGVTLRMGEALGTLRDPAT